MGERLVVQFARGARRNDQAPHPYQERSAPRPRRTPFRMQITSLPVETSWQVSTVPP
jgi:transcription initiation factor TFIID subunit 15